MRAAVTAGAASLALAAIVVPVSAGTSPPPPDTSGQVVLGGQWFVEPAGIARDDDGNLFVVDSKAATLSFLANDDGTFADPVVLLDADSGPGALSEPFGVDVADDGTVYVADERNDRIVMLAREGAAWGTPTPLFDNQLNGTKDVAVDSDGNLVIASTSDSKVLFAKRNGSGFDTPIVIGGAGGQGSGADQMHFPHGVAVDVAGNVYVADTHNHRIVRIQRSGAAFDTPVILGGSRGIGPAQFDYPQHLSVGPDGDIYVADIFNDRIGFIDADAGSFAASTPLVVDGSVLEVSFAVGITVDSSGDVMVSSERDRQVVAVAWSGSEFQSPTVVAGGPLAVRTGFDPSSADISASGLIVVGDRGNGEILLLDPESDESPLVVTDGVYPNSVRWSSDGDILVAGNGISRFTAASNYTESDIVSSGSFDAFVETADGTVVATDRFSEQVTVIPTNGPEYVVDVSVLHIFEPMLQEAPDGSILLADLDGHGSAKATFSNGILGDFEERFGPWVTIYDPYGNEFLVEPFSTPPTMESWVFGSDADRLLTGLGDRLVDIRLGGTGAGVVVDADTDAVMFIPPLADVVPSNGATIVEGDTPDFGFACAGDLNCSAKINGVATVNGATLADLGVGERQVVIRSDAGVLSTTTFTVQAAPPATDTPATDPPATKPGKPPFDPVIRGAYAKATGDLGTVARLYAAVFERQPDEQGIEYWMSQVEQGDLGLLGVAYWFGQSDEWEAAYGGTTDAELLDEIYARVFGRQIDEAGRRYWRGELDGGLSRTDMVFYLSESVEFQARTQTS